MCLAVPARIVELSGHDVVIDVLGNRRPADVSLLNEVQVGDYVLVHAGFAIRRLDDADARDLLATLRAMEDDADAPTG